MRIIVIFGGSSGIGLASADLFIKNGDTVYSVSRSACPNEFVKSILADITDCTAVFSALNEVFSLEGRIDILINSAGFSMGAPFEFTHQNDFNHLFNVNFFGVANAIKAVIPLMKDKGGKIINISSIASLAPIPYDAFYGASKSALNSLTLALRQELKSSKILLTAVLAGGTRTNFTKNRKVYSKESAGGYSENLQKAVSKIGKIEQNGMSAESVANVIFKLSLRKNPPATVCAGVRNKFARLVLRFMPERVLEILLSKIFLGHRA
ncbi:MAG: SDR family NAD(P)-dependent oxidoreductase [Firmicutes bacterium]|nr:SDR family NAD(P)-dependent oxidoreductase [Bacillota bacterium]